MPGLKDVSIRQKLRAVIVLTSANDSEIEG